LYSSCLRDSPSGDETDGAADRHEPEPLWRQQDQRDDARELLALINGWFTEGFDTPDLQEAKALLEELS
jgi:hypothetical protein